MSKSNCVWGHWPKPLSSRQRMTWLYKPHTLIIILEQSWNIADHNWWSRLFKRGPHCPAFQRLWWSEVVLHALSVVFFLSVKQQCPELSHLRPKSMKNSMWDRTWQSDSLHCKGNRLWYQVLCNRLGSPCCESPELFLLIAHQSF